MNEKKINDFLKLFLINNFKNLSHERNNNDSYDKQIKNFSYILWYFSSKAYKFLKGGTKKIKKFEKKKIFQ